VKANRRQFLATATAAATGTMLWGGCQTATNGRRILGANERLNLGCIGTSGRAASNLKGVQGENIVALCDIDDTLLAARTQEFPQAKLHHDFRRMLEQTDIDAVVVSTPDHTHAVATVAALQSGRHVYCEKPLTRTVSETRIVRDLAARSRLATQMGNQIHAGDNYRRVVEAVTSGTIGSVNEVHVWSASTYGHLPYPAGFAALPPQLNWELWLGPVEPWPYHPDFIPAKWRNWWHFGGGSLSDFGCHYMDLPHWALGLRAPETVEALDTPAADPKRPPVAMTLRYEYPARGAQPAVTLYWYQGGRAPAQLPEKFAKDFRAGVLFIGSGGMLLSNYSQQHLLPEEKFAGWKRPEPTIAKSVGHHEEWIRACKTGSPTLSNFAYAGALSEAVLLGNVAHRAGQKIVWDTKTCRVTNCPAAAEFVQHQYRAGWKI
jgi:predicted dehydrogenase